MKQKNPPIIVSTFVVGQMATNCYVLKDPVTSEIVIIDPGEDAGYIIEKVASMEGKPSVILATHGHFDHILGAREIQLTFRIPFFIHASDAFLVARMKDSARHFLKRDVVELPPHIDGYIKDGARVAGLTVMETPGHTPGSISLVSDTVILTGDTIFAGGVVGRVDFSYADKQSLMRSIRNIIAYPPHMKIFPGHGAESTVDREKPYHMV